MPNKEAKIDSLGLGIHVVELNRQHPGKFTHIAREISSKYDVSISKHNVMDWLKRNSEATSKKGLIKQEAMKMLAEDRDHVVGEYDKLMAVQLEEIYKILDDKKADPSKKISLINQLVGPKGGMNRALNAVGFGTNNTTVNINQQINFVQDRISEIAKIIVEECNGSSERVLKRFELLSQS